MKVPGYCTGCRRVKRVTVTGHNLAMAQATGGGIQGICDACRQAEEDRRLGRCTCGAAQYTSCSCRLSLRQWAADRHRKRLPNNIG